MELATGALVRLTHNTRGAMLVMVERPFNPHTTERWPVTAVQQQDMMGMAFYLPGPPVDIARCDVASFSPHRDRT